jgi:hypothetical protein
MADMIHNSRLSNGVRAAGLMRRAVTEALYVAHHRTAFGHRLVALPLLRRPLAKLQVRAEQARTMMFQTAEALHRADAGENDAYALLRIVTPLIKFRACHDARVVTGDAMEVCGGVGYAEEWPDARLLRGAHLGSIWEGASNIVALDVLRAARREGSLDALDRHLCELFKEATGLPEAPAMAWEAASTGDSSRLALAPMVLRHRVMPRDPLDPANPDADGLGTLLYEPAT